MTYLRVMSIVSSGRDEREVNALLVDYHIHSMGHMDYESDFQVLQAFVDHARKRGVMEIGFSDHDRYRDKMDADAFEKVRHNNPDMKIRLGVEAEFFPGKEKETARFLNGLPLDYAIGSVHYIGDWAFDDPAYIDGYNGKDPDELYAAYYDLVALSAKSMLFDIIGHMDLIKVFGLRPKGSGLDLARPAIEAIREAGCAIEINTNGAYKPVEEIYPHESLLGACFDAGIPVTLGSDAHRPEDAGRDISKAAVYAKRVGYTKVAAFHKRRRYFVPL